ncbi:alanine racemase [Carnobacterium iners]|uniref:Alanine racemase n=1 Tax=Carnobacterium iners TaxID=1073423 RepID=A0A1X7MQI0_9LACT|nr:alanine racemase [Carnobacterium iners]SEL12465.1 alanine racemase [Carnobacterium iners]SMH27099.1 alanine racemase [Carnobacterium iners]
MAIGVHRKTIAYIDKKAISTNVQQEIKRLDENVVLYAVVKANGYGHGAVEVAAAAKEGGASGFCVAILDEALELRKAGFTEPILIMGLVDATYADLIALNKLSVAVSSLDWLERANKIVKNNGCEEKLLVHIALDTGMGRIGIRIPEELQEVEQWINKSETTYFEGVFTHFATADSPDQEQFIEQAEKFNTLIASLHRKPPFIHVANSATALWHQSCSSNMIRFGIAMYGLNPSGGILKEPYKLVPAMRISSEVNYVKQMKLGDTVGYGATYSAKEGEWVGTVPIGYADGWRRDLQGQDVLVDGKRCEIIGRICMDQCMIRLPYEVEEGTEVILVGESENEKITLQDIANHLGTIHYEIACGLATRVPRIYI